MAEDYLEVPSIGLAVYKKKIPLSNFEDMKNKIHSDKKKILNLYEFAEFLKVAKEKDRKLYDEISQVRFPNEAELFDTKFWLRGNKMWIHSHKFTENGILIPDYKVLDSDTLMENKTPGISLEKWVNDHTKQGLPKNSIQEGDMHYWKPKDGAIAMFHTGGNWVLLDGSLNVSDSYLFNAGTRFGIQLK